MFLQLIAFTLPDRQFDHVSNINHSFVQRRCSSDWRCILFSSNEAPKEFVACSSWEWEQAFVDRCFLLVHLFRRDQVPKSTVPTKLQKSDNCARIKIYLGNFMEMTANFVYTITFLFPQRFWDQHLEDQL